MKSAFHSVFTTHPCIKLRLKYLLVAVSWAMLLFGWREYNRGKCHDTFSYRIRGPPVVHGRAGSAILQGVI